MSPRRNVKSLDPLTPREMDVLVQLAEGLSNREIAQELNIALSTTKWFLRQIYDKLDAHRRTEAVMIANEIGLLDQKEQQTSPANHNLPNPTTPFIGRNREVDELKEILQNDEIRLITITGTGGVGKTRLALEIARSQVDRFDDGVYFIPLASIQTPDELFHIIAGALDLKFHGTSDAREQILGYLQFKNVMLVLDNFEHLMDQGAHRVNELLEHVPELCLLCTSRQSLNLRGEAVYSIRGLDYPGWQPTELSTYSSIQLFIQRAKLADPQIKLSDDVFQKVAHICRLIEGMPLAIELVANWIASLSISEISTQVESNLDVLVAELHDLPQRHHSIREVFDHSWELLDGDERDVFRKLSIFADSFSLEAGQFIGEASLKVIASLLNKSLLRRDRQNNRYDMHGLVRKFGREKLDELGNPSTTYQRYIEFYSHFLRDQVPLLKGEGQTRAMRLIKTDYENCVTAWRWSIQHRKDADLNRMIDGLYLFLLFQVWLNVGRDLFEQAREQWSVNAETDCGLAGRLSVRFPIVQGNQALIAIFERGLTIAEANDTLSEIAFCQRELGLQLGHRGEDDAEIIRHGINLLESSLQIYREMNDRYYEAQLLDDIGWCYTRLHNRQKRIEYSKRSIELRHEIGDVMGLGRAISGYLNLIVFDNSNQAEQLVEDTYDLAVEEENYYLMVETCILQGIHPMMFHGEPERARPKLEEALKIAKQIKFEYGRRIAQLLLATLVCIEDKNTRRATELIHCALPHDWIMDEEIAYLLYGTMAYLSYHTLNGNYQQIRSRLQSIWHLPRNQNPTPDTLWLLPFVALILNEAGNKAYAVKLLSLSAEHEMTIGFAHRLAEWEPIADLRLSLCDAMGDEVFNKLWAEGRSLDLKDIVNRLQSQTHLPDTTDLDTF